MDLRASEVTAALAAWSAGDKAALSRVLPLVYTELRALAAQQLRKEGPGHTLEPTGLVHEAFLRLAGRGTVHVAARAQFFAVAAQAMRRVLVDHARRRRAEKRGGGQARLSITAAAGLLDCPRVDLAELDDALARLEGLDTRQARIVELKFFAGLPVDEIAVALEVSPATVHRDWRMARAWLRNELESGAR
jgi:RNA polymerase sigma factor (TIGR02999 family)